MRRIPLVLALMLVVAACTTGGQETAPPAPTDTVATSVAPPTTNAVAPPATTVPDTTLPPTTVTTTTAATSEEAPAATPTSPTAPDPEPILIEPAAAPDSASAVVVGGEPVTIGPTDTEVTVQVTITYTPAGYCGFFNICGWADHAVDDPWVEGDPFTDQDVNPDTVEFTIPFDPSEGDTKQWALTYGAGEFFGLGELFTQVKTITVMRLSS